MSAISGPEDGPVAVTGASGFIGSEVVTNLVAHGYNVRACVRDASREDKVSYLLELNDQGSGSVELYSCDLAKANDGSYDEAFAGCSAVFHVAANIGTDKSYGKNTPQDVYQGLLDATGGVLESCRKAGTVKRLIYTSSTAAVFGPREKGHYNTWRYENHVFTEDDWAGGPYETLEERHIITDDNGEEQHTWNIETQAYDKGKLDTEKMAYEYGAQHGIDVITVCPCHVLGPLKGKVHHVLWQRRLGLMLGGTTDFPPEGFSWNIIDTRDIAETQRLAATSDVAQNGSRYLMVAADESGEPTTDMVIDMLRELFPDMDIAGGYYPPRASHRLYAKCTKAIEELGLKPHDIKDTLRVTGETLIKHGCIEPAYKK